MGNSESPAQHHRASGPPGAWRDSARGAALTVLIGVLLSALAWYEVISSSLLPIVAALIGPMAVAVGLAKLIHGPGVRLGVMSRGLRVYAVAGSLIGVLQLFLLGFFRHPELLDVFFILLIIGIVWFAPAKRRAENAENGTSDAAG